MLISLDFQMFVRLLHVVFAIAALVSISVVRPPLDVTHDPRNLKCSTSLCYFLSLNGKVSSSVDLRNIDYTVVDFQAKFEAFFFE